MESLFNELRLVVHTSYIVYERTTDAVKIRHVTANTSVKLHVFRAVLQFCIRYQWTAVVSGRLDLPMAR